MNTTTRTIGAVGLGALAAIGIAAGGIAAASAAPLETAAAPAAIATDDLTDALTFVREEERMARDLYAAIADEYDGARPFSMITRSEDQHFDAIGTLLDRYDIEDPSDGLAAGTYADDDLQALYDDLLAEAQTSLAAAYGVGITIEETDITDLDAAIAADYPADVDRVLTNLMEGSENHLAAFTAAADGTFAAQSGANGPRGGAADGQGTGMQARGDAAGQGAGRGPGNANRGGNGATTATRADGDCLLMQ